MKYIKGKSKQNLEVPRFMGNIIPKASGLGNTRNLREEGRPVHHTPNTIVGRFVRGMKSSSFYRRYFGQVMEVEYSPT